MKLNKTLLIAFSAFFSLSTYTQANTAPAEKPKQTAAQKKQMEKNLKQFNTSINIKLVSRSIAEDQSGKKIISVKYELTNKSSKDIKSVNWVSGYTFDNKVIALQDLPINFDPALKAKDKIAIEVEIPLEKLSAQAQQLFLSQEAVIGAVSGAKRLDFTKGKPIIVE